MSASTPRWEWRTFGREFGPAETRIRAYPLQRRDSSETYIVSSRPDANTKIRDELLDLKTLQATDAHGLELWLPVMKAAFPLTRGPIETTFGVWGLQPPERLEEPWSQQQFFARVAAYPSLSVIPVTKQRYGGTIDDCLVEVADLTFGGEAIRTIAVEMADPARVWRTVRDLGLADYDNVNYVKALKRFLAQRVP